MRNERVDVLILGGGAAGHSAAQAVRECGEDTSILMISQEEIGRASCRERVSLVV